MTTPEYDRKDVLLAKECNMNFIRTSHYPPSETFLDYCDQYGIYVEDETAVCFVGSHRTEAYQATGASRTVNSLADVICHNWKRWCKTTATIPSVIIWSIGNENVFGENFVKSYQWVKENDPTRPVIYSYPGQVPDTLQIYEILSMHYPSWQGDLDQYGINTRDFNYDLMPVLFDEWAHVACYNNFELKEDPNVAISGDRAWTACGQTCLNPRVDWVVPSGACWMRPSCCPRIWPAITSGGVYWTKTLSLQPTWDLRGLRRMGHCRYLA